NSQTLNLFMKMFQEEVAVTPDQIGSTHFWNWTSHLALECVSHSVRLSSRYKNHTLVAVTGKENSAEPEVYPRDRIIKVGSNVTFCCVLPAGQTFERMYVTGYSTNVDATKISNRTYALTVHLTQTTSVICTNVKCKARTQQQESTDNGAYPPGDKDLRCETRDLESVACHWTVGRNTHLHTNPTTYKLLGRCSQKVRVNASETTWTLTAQNELGTVELSERADLTRRVYMFAPEGVTASTVNARNVSLEWSWTVKRYNNLNITCQVNVRHGGTDATDFGVGLASAVLTGLMPKWTYNASVRCRTMEHSWKWSEWSTALVFQTRGDGSAAVASLLQMLPDNQSHGHIIDYTVTWAKKTTETERRNTTTVDHNEQRVVLSVDTTDQYLVTVTARNTNGSSSPSTITTPHFNPGVMLIECDANRAMMIYITFSFSDTTRLNTSWFTGSNGRVSLSWSASPAARCGYVVDWHPTSDPWIVDWLKVPPHETNATIFSKNFQSGLRYSFSISACTQAAPVLLERGEGYVWEENGLFKTLTWKQKGSDVEVSWLPISPTEQSAFIQGYILYWSDNNNDDSHNVVFNVSTAVCLHSTADNLITATFISLVAVFSLLSLVTVVCYRHWAW
uniref:Fibronectin type-III domain-containing protein n=1 Tax=Scophthalmus maximus TaxID=52904 RepID=A0A8D3AIV2_SCOMX